MGDTCLTVAHGWVRLLRSYAGLPLDLQETRASRQDAGLKEHWDPVGAEASMAGC